MNSNNIKKYTEQDIENVCKIIENRCRQLGQDCEVIFVDDGVSIAPPSWPGDSFGTTFYEALKDAECIEN